jgi:hypothetical protein
VSISIVLGAAADGFANKAAATPRAAAPSMKPRRDEWQ